MTGAASSRAAVTDAGGCLTEETKLAMSSKQANSEIAESPVQDTRQVASPDAEPVACHEAVEAAHGRQRGRTRGRTAGPKQALGR